MRCNNCLNEIKDGYAFCDVCGARQSEVRQNGFVGGENFSGGNAYDPGSAAGNRPNAENNQNNQGNSAGHDAYSQTNPMNSYGYAYNPYLFPGFMQMNGRVPQVKEYLQWMLVYPLLNMIPFVGFILYLVFCINFMNDKSYPARSNFFKATLISWAISAGIGIVFSVLAALLTFFVLDGSGLYY